MQASGLIISGKMENVDLLLMSYRIAIAGYPSGSFPLPHKDGINSKHCNRFIPTLSSDISSKPV